tara:strand:- start:54 stop:437 length:384 start_codon:yes stop_codon:yes gene_type:complete
MNRRKILTILLIMFSQQVFADELKMKCYSKIDGWNVYKYINNPNVKEFSKKDVLPLENKMKFSYEWDLVCGYENSQCEFKENIVIWKTLNGSNKITRNFDFKKLKKNLINSEKPRNNFEVSCKKVSM